MKKLLVIALSITCYSTGLLSSLKTEDFNKAMRELWNDHAVWTREYIISALGNLPNKKLVTKRLLKNQVDIGNAIIPFYGKETAKKLSTLLKDHILIAADLITATKKKDTKAIKKLDIKWRKNGTDISRFLSKTNPYIKFNAMKAMMFEHLDLINKMLEFQLKKKCLQDIKSYDTYRKQLNHLADELAEALVHAFPDKFEATT